MVGALAVLGVLGFTGIVRPRSDSIDEVITMLKADKIEALGRISELERVVGSQIIEIQRLREESVMLRTQIFQLESSNLYHPFPVWNVDKHGVLTSANSAFEDYFLSAQDKPLIDFIGLSLKGIFNEGFEDYMENHNYVLSKKRYWEGAINVAINGKQQATHMVLYPHFAGKQVVGIYGMIIPIESTRNYMQNS